MVVLQKDNSKFGKQEDTGEITGFAQTYKGAYSHGLESIYALENVDPRSIRRLHDPGKESKFEISQPKRTPKKQGTNLPQLEFDFGPGFRKWIIPLVLHEPIQVLELTRHAEKCLAEHGKHYLKDLVHFDLREFIFFKGMGQGHIDEVRQKLENYLAGKELERTKSVDFASWLRCLTAAANRKKVHVCLLRYDLSDLLALMPSESMEIRRLTELKKEEWADEALQELRESSRSQFVQDNMRSIVDALVKPWMTLRMGFSTTEEILERMECVSEEPELVYKALSFLSEAYFSQRFPLGNFLYQASEGIYCVGPWHQQAFLDIIEKASTYFYKPKIFYALDELVPWIEREFAKEWQGFPCGMIEKVLRLSQHFTVWKGNNGKLAIRLA